MEFEPEEIKGQVDSTIKALNTLSAGERKLSPKNSYIENFNRLLELSKKSLPKVV